MINHVMGLFTHPTREWREIRSENESLRHLFLTHTLVLAAVPAVSGFIGTTLVGWQIGERQPVMLTASSALTIALATFVMLLAGVWAMGSFIHWMARSYNAYPSLARCIAFATYTASPLFIAGLAALYPHLWLGMSAGLVALGYSAFLLYSGLPTFMDVSEEEGFLFSSSVMAVGLVVLVAIIAFSVVAWGFGAGPVYTR